MSSETFTIEQVRLLEEAVLCFSKESSRKLMESERVPLQSAAVKTQIQENRKVLDQQLDDLALIRAKLITLRHYIQAESNPQAVAEESSNQSNSSEEE